MLMMVIVIAMLGRGGVGLNEHINDNRAAELAQIGDAYARQRQRDGSGDRAQEGGLCGTMQPKPPIQGAWIKIPARGRQKNEDERE